MANLEDTQLNNLSNRLDSQKTSVVQTPDVVTSSDKPSIAITPPIIPGVQPSYDSIAKSVERRIQRSFVFKDKVDIEDTPIKLDYARLRSAITIGLPRYMSIRKVVELQVAKSTAGITPPRTMNVRELAKGKAQESKPTTDTVRPVQSSAYNTDAIISNQLATSRHVELINVHKQQLSLLKSMHRFQTEMQSKFMAQNIGLGYRQTVLQNDALELARAFAATVEGKLEAIKINTGIPDSKKKSILRLVGEGLAKSFMTNTANAITKPIAERIGASVTKNVTEPILEKASQLHDKIPSAVSAAADVVQGKTKIKDLYSSTKEKITDRIKAKVDSLGPIIDPMEMARNAREDLGNKIRTFSEKISNKATPEKAAAETTIPSVEPHIPGVITPAQRDQFGESIYNEVKSFHQTFKDWINRGPHTPTPVAHSPTPVGKAAFMNTAVVSPYIETEEESPAEAEPKQTLRQKLSGIVKDKTKNIPDLKIAERTSELKETLRTKVLPKVTKKVEESRERVHEILDDQELKDKVSEKLNRGKAIGKKAFDAYTGTNSLSKADVEETVGQRLDKLYDLLNERLVKPTEVRANSYQDQMAHRQGPATLQDVTAKIAKDKAVKGGGGSGILGILGGIGKALKGGAKAVAGTAEKAAPAAEGGSLLGDIAGSAVGSAAGSLGLGSVAKKGLGLAGKVAGFGLKTSGKILGLGAKAGLGAAALGGGALASTGIPVVSGLGRGIAGAANLVSGGSQFVAKAASAPGAAIAGAKMLGKTALRVLPGVGLALGAGLAAKRAMAGDWGGAGLELLTGAAGMIPGLGIPLALAGQAAIAYRDSKREEAANSQMNFEDKLFNIRKMNYGFAGGKDDKTIRELEQDSVKGPVSDSTLADYASKFGFDPKNADQMKYFKTWYDQKFMANLSAYQGVFSKAGIDPFKPEVKDTDKVQDAILEYRKTSSMIDSQTRELTPYPSSFKNGGKNALAKAAAGGLVPPGGPEGGGGGKDIPDIKSEYGMSGADKPPIIPASATEEDRQRLLNNYNQSTGKTLSSEDERLLTDSGYASTKKLEYKPGSGTDTQPSGYDTKKLQVEHKTPNTASTGQSGKIDYKVGQKTYSTDKSNVIKFEPRRGQGKAPSPAAYPTSALPPRRRNEDGKLTPDTTVPESGPSVDQVGVPPVPGTQGPPVVTDHPSDTVIPSVPGAPPPGNDNVGPPSDLGSMSAKYESSKKGSMAVGYDKVGGTSYGKYQISSKTGTFDSYTKWLRKQGPEGTEVADRLEKAGAANSGDTKGAVSEEWKKLVSEGKMGNFEHDFIKQTKYDAALNKLSPDLKAKVSSDPALQQVLWSTAVQHGEGGAAKIFTNASAKGGDLVDAVYDERATKFGSSTDAVQASVRKRFDEERKLAKNYQKPSDSDTIQVADNQSTGGSPATQKLTKPSKAISDIASSKSPTGDLTYDTNVGSGEPTTSITDEMTRPVAQAKEVKELEKQEQQQAKSQSSTLSLPPEFSQVQMGTHDLLKQSHEAMMGMHKTMSELTGHMKGALGNDGVFSNMHDSIKGIQPNINMPINNSVSNQNKSGGNCEDPTGISVRKRGLDRYNI